MSTDKDKKKRVKWADLKKAMRIFSYIKPFRIQFGIGFLFLTITAIASLAFPKYIAQLMASNANTLTTNITILVVLLLVQSAAGFFRILIFVNVTEKSLAHIRQEVYTNLIQLPMRFFSEKRVGELNSRVASDTAQIQETLTSTLAEFFRQMFMIVGGIVYLSITSTKLTLFIVAVIPTLMIAAIVFGKFIRKYAKTVQKEVAESNTIVEETLQGIQTVKAFVNEWFEVKRYTQKTNQVAKTAIKGGVYRAAFASFIIVGIFGAIVAVIWFAVKMKLNGEIEGDQISEFLLYAVFIGGSVGGLANVYSNIQKTIGATEDLFEILDNNIEDITLQKVENIPHFKGEIELIDIEFSYPSRKDVPVLNKLSFKAHAGQQIALVGPSGAGKSTIIQLLMQFYQPNGGSIKVDGKDANQYSLSQLRNQMAIVPQDVLLFGGTIEENIAYGKPGASLSQIEDAAKKANALEFINGFPQGFKTIVGERGIQLSGGQRQRIAIARAVLKDPKILLLDEATSSLDSESEKLVQEALDQLMKNRTSVVIAHRLSTIRNANKILVIQNGSVLESGTHQELMQHPGGLYKQLSKNQFME